MKTAVERRKAWWQLLRYAVNGGLLTLLYDIVYTAVERLSAAPLQVANLTGYLAAVIAGYFLHSRVTFRDHGTRTGGTRLRFALASLLSFAINAFWTWLLADHWHLHPEAPLIPISTITPMILFAVHRWWVFR